MNLVLKELRRHKLRTLLSIGGFTITTVFLVILYGMNSARNDDSFGILRSTGTHFIVYIPTDERSCTSQDANINLIAEGVNTMMLDNELLGTIRNVSGVRDAAPCLLFKMYHGNFHGEVSLAGIDTASIATNSNTCSKSNLIAGKYLSANPGELVAEQAFASAHGLSLGDTLNLFGGRMRIAGIVNSGIKPVKADFYAPIEHVRTIMKDKLSCNAPSFDLNIVLVEVSDSRLQDKVMKNIGDMLYKFTISSYNCYEPAYRVMSILDSSSSFLTIFIVLFLIIFSARTQVNSIVERMREIGILKSLGWSDYTLCRNIIIVSLIQAFAGVTAGILLGYIITVLLQNSGLPVARLVSFRFDVLSIPVVYLLSMSGALIASVFALIRIVRNRAGDIIKNYTF
ncbi:MAG TPA: FtsX-like permease family protein [Bacteroidales bacterium]|nr:FtsX-like permease family protein [Bacteroidales bacterium]